MGFSGCGTLERKCVAFIFLLSGCYMLSYIFLTCFSPPVLHIMNWCVTSPLIKVLPGPELFKTFHLSPDAPLWINPVAMGVLLMLLHYKPRYSAGGGGVSGFVNSWTCGVWHHRLTICPMCVSFSWLRSCKRVSLYYIKGIDNSS